MSAISNFLSFLRSAIYAIDVRDGIADAIEQCYNDVNNPTLKTEALEAALQTKIDEGEMAALTIGDHTITAAKLAQGVIDNTLATSGAAADAKKTGDELSALKADLGAQTGIIRLVKDYFINTSTTPISLTPMPSSAGRMSAVVDCSTGDKFVINAYSDSSVARAWCFIDNTNNAISMADYNATVTDLELTAPENAVKLIINDISGGMSYKVGNNLATKADNVLSDDIKLTLLACFNHVAWSGTGGRTYYNTLKNVLYPEGNLINGIELTWDNGYINANGELDKLLNGSFTSDYFEVSNFSNYQITVQSEDWDARRMAFYTATYGFISRVLTENGEIPSNAVYCRCTVGNLQLSGQTEYDGAGTSILLT